MSNGLKIIIVPLIMLVILMAFTRVSFANSPASCISNSCFTTDSITFADASQLFLFTIHAIDNFIFGEHGSISNVVTLIVKDIFKITDINNFRTTLIKVFDVFKTGDFSILNGNAITTIVTFVTSTLTQLASSCSGSSCYQNASATGMEALAEQIIFPLIFIVGTVFGFMYMGLKLFGIMVMVATFIILGLAYIGIIPSYFTLLTIVAVGAALTKMIMGMIGTRE